MTTNRLSATRAAVLALALAAVALPTTGWTVHIAARYHERKKGPSDKRLAVGPDVPVDLTSTVYFAGRDPVLERALRGL